MPPDEFASLLSTDQARSWLTQLTDCFFDREAKKAVLAAVRAGLPALAPGADGEALKQLGDDVVQELCRQASRTAVPPARPEEPAPLSGPAFEDEVLDHYPYPVAAAFQALTEQTNDAARFGCLLDTFEALIHYLATVAVSAYLRTDLASADCNRFLLMKLLGSSLEPKWATGDLFALLRETVRFAGDCGGRLPYPLPALLFLPGGKPTPACRVLESFIELRNERWGHGTGRTEEAFAKIVAPNRERLEQELGRMRWLSGQGGHRLIRPVVIEGGRVTKADLLEGSRRRQARPFGLVLEERDLVDHGGDVRADRNTLLLVAPDGRSYLPLFPLSLFQLGIGRPGHGTYFLQKLKWQREASLWRLSKASYVCYAGRENEPHNEGPREFVASSLDRHVARLRAVLPEDAGAAETEPAGDPDFDLPEVWSQQAAQRRVFVGREDWLTKLHDWIDGRGEGSYLLVLGPPGQGKSALLAELAHRANARGNCLLHMMKSHGDPRRFLPFLIGQGARLAETTFGASKYRGSIDDLRNSLVEALTAVRDKRGRAVLVIDALDEMGDRQAPAPFAWLPPALPEGVCAVLASRHDAQLVNRLHGQLPNLETFELSPFSEADFHLLLEHRLEVGRIRHLEGALDLGALFRWAGGNPLLLTLAIRTIDRALSRHATLDPDDLKDLVSSVDRVFGEIYAEIAGSSQPTDQPGGSQRASLLKFLCLAQAPLRLEQLGELMTVNGTPLSLEDTARRVAEMSEYLLHEGGSFQPWHQRLTEHVITQVLGPEGCRRVEAVYCRWLDGSWGDYGLRYRVTHLLEAHRLGAAQFDRMRELLSGAFLEEKADRLDVWAALGDTERLAEMLAGTGTDQWELFRACVYRHCALIEEMRGGPRALEKLVEQRSVERVEILLRRDRDDFRRGLLRLALAPLLAEQGYHEQAAAFESLGRTYVELRLRGVAEKVPGYSRETTWLACARLIQAPESAPAPAEPEPPAGPVPKSGGVPVSTAGGRDWAWIALGYVHPWSVFVFILGTLVAMGLFSEWWWAVLAAGVGVGVAYSRLVKRGLAGLMRGLKERMEAGDDAERRRALRRAARLGACWLEGVPASWHEDLNDILLRGFPLFADAPEPAAEIALHMSTGGGPRCEAAIRAVKGLKAPQCEAIREALYAKLGKRRPLLPHLSLLAATSTPRSAPEPFLKTLQRYVPGDQKVDVKRLVAAALRSAPPAFLGRVTLASLQRDMAAARKAEAAGPAPSTSRGRRRFAFLQPRALRWGFVPSPLVQTLRAIAGALWLAVAGAFTLVLRFGSLNRHAPYGLALVLNQPAADQRRSLAYFLHQFGWSVPPELRALRDAVLAQAILRDDADSLALLATKPVFKRVIQTLVRENLVNQRRVALVVMDDRELLDAAVSREIVPEEGHALRTVDESADGEQLRRALPLQPVWWSWLVVLGVSSCTTLVCLRVLAAFVPEPARSWLAGWALVEAVVVCAVVASLQHVFSLGHAGRAIPRLLEGASKGRPAGLLVLPRFVLRAAQWLDGVLNASFWRLVAGVGVFGLLSWAHDAFMTWVHQAYPSLPKRMPAGDGLLLLFLPVLVTNLLTPELVARWRGTEILYPEADRLRRRRAAWLTGFAASCALLLLLHWQSGVATYTHEVFTLTGHKDRINSVAYSPDGKYLASASEDETVKIWDVQGGRELVTLSGHADFVTSVAFHPDGGQFASASRNQTIRIWAVPSWEVIRIINLPPLDHAWEIAYSRDGRFLLAAVNSDLFRLAVLTPLVGASPLWPATLGRVVVYDAATGDKLRDCPMAHWQGVNSAAIAPDGGLFASGGTDKTVKVGDRQTGKLIRSLTGHEGAVTEVAFSPDGKWLASASGDRTVKLWDLESGQEVRTFRGHEAEVEWVAFHPHLPLLASTSKDRTVRVWDLYTGGEVLRLEGHSATVMGGAFSPDGRFLATGGWDKTVRVWDLLEPGSPPLAGAE